MTFSGTNRFHSFFFGAVFLHQRFDPSLYLLLRNIILVIVFHHGGVNYTPCILNIPWERYDYISFYESQLHPLYIKHIVKKIWLVIFHAGKHIFEKTTTSSLAPLALRAKNVASPAVSTAASALWTGAAWMISRYPLWFQLAINLAASFCSARNFTDFISFNLYGIKPCNYFIVFFWDLIFKHNHIQTFHHLLQFFVFFLQFPDKFISWALIYGCFSLDLFRSVRCNII